MRIPSLLLAAAIAAAAAAADAATLRPSATVDADVLRVGDIFEDAGHHPLFATSTTWSISLIAGLKAAAALCGT